MQYYIIILSHCIKNHQLNPINSFMNPETNSSSISIQRLSTQEKNLLCSHLERAKEFITRHQSSKHMFFLTSGGTSVPLQKNTVRTMENFSTGTRGSLLAKQILRAGHPVIFFYRDNSFMPFASGATLNQAISSQDSSAMDQILEARRLMLKHADHILLLPFKTIYFYLEGIQALSALLSSHSILILCAAVSDFVPKEVVEHKIQTSKELTLQLNSSPKILGKMVNPLHLCVSFKLETDPAILQQKIDSAIVTYNVDLVVGNLLGNKGWVRIKMNPQQFEGRQPVEIEASNREVQRGILDTILKMHEVKFSKEEK